MVGGRERGPGLAVGGRRRAHTIFAHARQQKSALAKPYHHLIQSDSDWIRLVVRFCR